MAGENTNEPEDEILEVGEPAEDAGEVNDQDSQAAGDAEDDFEIPTFGDDAEPQEDDTNLVKHLRDQIRDRDRRLAEREKAEKEPEIVVGEKPSLWDDDIAGDEDKYDAALLAWQDRKRQAAEKADQGQEAKRQSDEAWQGELAEYAKKKAALPYRDVEDAEATVVASLSKVQQALIVKTANDPAKLIYALGKHPAKLAALAAVSDPVKFIAATVRLDAEVKMAKRKPTVEPEKIVRGSGSMRSSDQARDKLIEKAQAGGDVTETLRALREERKRKQAA